MPAEQWRPIPSAPGYEASNLGRVRSVDRVVETRRGPRRCQGQVLATAVTRKGYRMVRLGYDAPMRTLHSLVAEAWHGPRPDGYEVCHGPGGQQDNSPTNLRYDTISANKLDTVRDGTHVQARKFCCPREHDLVEPNLVPSRLPDRICLACSRASGRVQHMRRSGAEVTPEQFREIADGYHREIMARAA